MSSTAEDVLYLSLTDTDALETLAKRGLDLECIPTEEMRQVVSWALDRFFESGRVQAPSRAALLATWQQEIDDAGIELLAEDEEADQIEWAISQLAAQYVHYEYQTFLKASGTTMAQTPAPDKVAMLAVQANELFSLSLRMQPRHLQAEGLTGFRDSLARYEVRAIEGHQTRGMTFDLDQVDEHTYGIHDGELAVIAGGPKTGKSFFVSRTALKEWRLHKNEIVTLFTMENAVDMTLDRMVCQELGIDSRNYQRGKCADHEIERVRAFNDEHKDDIKNRLNIIMPEQGNRTMSAMVRQAQMLGTTRLFIDQLTFVEHADPGRKARNEIIRDLMHELKVLISTGKTPMPCLIAHQINREGMKAAAKSGFLAMEMLAEGSEVERTADWVFGLYQSSEERIQTMAKLQILAARREDLNAWQLLWQPSNGAVTVIRKLDIAA
jgi:replicative DNA helicase